MYKLYVGTVCSFLGGSLLLEKEMKYMKFKIYAVVFFSEPLFLAKFIDSLKRSSSDKLTSFFLKFYILPA